MDCDVISIFRNKNGMNHDRKKKEKSYHALPPREEITNLFLNTLATNTKKEPSH